MHAAGALGRGHALHAVRAGLPAQRAIDPPPAHRRGRRAQPARVARRQLDHLRATEKSEAIWRCTACRSCQNMRVMALQMSRHGRTTEGTQDEGVDGVIRLKTV